MKLFRVLFEDVQVWGGPRPIQDDDDPSRASEVLESGTMVACIDSREVAKRLLEARYHRVMTPSGFVGWIFEGNLEEVGESE